MNFVIFGIFGAKGSDGQSVASQAGEPDRQGLGAQEILLQILTVARHLTKLFETLTPSWISRVIGGFQRLAIDIHPFLCATGNSRHVCPSAADSDMRGDWLIRFTDNNRHACHFIARIRSHVSCSHGQIYWQKLSFIEQCLYHDLTGPNCGHQGQKYCCDDLKREVSTLVI